MSLIEDGPPTDWRGLQTAVHQILTECGMRAEIEREVKLARGSVEVDVFAEDPDPTPSLVYVCECKNWAAAVPQTVVHSFRNVVLDSGANLGLIISRVGFQSGAHEAAAFSNIRLLTWEDFQRLFAQRWVERCMRPTLAHEGDPLIEYTEPINSRISRKADKLSSERQREVQILRERWRILGMGLSLVLSFSSEIPPLPLRSSPLGPNLVTQNIPDEVLDAGSLRIFMTALVRAYRHAISEFDDAFGGRA